MKKRIDKLKETNVRLAKAYAADGRVIREKNGRIADLQGLMQDHVSGKQAAEDHSTARRRALPESDEKMSELATKEGE